MRCYSCCVIYPDTNHIWIHNNYKLRRSWNAVLQAACHRFDWEHPQQSHYIEIRIHLR